jgi:hypothetical protein
VLAESIVAVCLAAQVAAAAPRPPSVLSATAVEVGAVEQEGERLSNEVAKLTGAQLSPLFFMGVLGGARWLRANVAERPRLPWHQQPWFWGSALALALFLWLGDKVPVLRHAVKHVKLVENHLSGAVAALVLVSAFASSASGAVGRATAVLGAALVPGAFAADGSGAALSAAGAGAAYALAWVLGLAISAAVWLAGHSVNVLVLVNPFAPLDALLRTGRLAVAAAVIGAAQLGAALGLALPVAVIVAAFAAAGWSLRLAVLGAVFSGDVLLGRAAEPPGDGIPAFAGRAAGVPARTYGRLAREGDALRFRYRPWLVLPPRRVALPRAAAVGRGLVTPVLLLERGRGEELLARFPPRFRGRADALAGALGALPVRDVAVVRGLKAAWAWLRDGGVAARPA